MYVSHVCHVHDEVKVGDVCKLKTKEETWTRQRCRLPAQQLCLREQMSDELCDTQFLGFHSNFTDEAVLRLHCSIMSTSQILYTLLLHSDYFPLEKSHLERNQAPENIIKKHPAKKQKELTHHREQNNSTNFHTEVGEFQVVTKIKKHALAINANKYTRQFKLKLKVSQ